MNTSECLYCGMTTSSENSICETCDFAVSASQNLDDAIASERPDHQAVYSNNFGVQQQTTPENSAYSFQQSSSQSSNNYPPRDFRPPRQTAPRTSCVKCHRQIPAGQRVCFPCGSKKIPVKKFKMVFAVCAVFALAGIGAYAYKVYVQNSPAAFLKKYAIATGSDKMGSVENVTSKGKVDIKLTASPANKNLARTINEIYSFDLTLQPPNKSYMVFYKPDPADASRKEIVYKQAFDGFNGWKYAKMFDQPPTLEDSKGGSSQSGPEMFFDDYESVEYLTDEMKADYGADNLVPLMSVPHFFIDGNVRASNGKTAIQVVKNNQKTLLIFDRDSHLLLGIFRKENVKNVPIIAAISIDNYKTVTIKGKNSEDVTILTPTKWKFEMNEEKPKDLVKSIVSHIDPGKVSVSMSMTLDIEKTESNPPIEDKVFLKPITVYTAETRGY